MLAFAPSVRIDRGENRISTARNSGQRDAGGTIFTGHLKTMVSARPNAAFAVYRN
jgi:hypothetical protein